MAKTNWEQVAAQYAAAQAKTGISAKDWCEKIGINYQSARRYLKSRGQSPEQPDTFQAAAQSAQKKVRKTAQNGKSAQSAGTAQKRKSEKALRKSGDESELSACETAKPNGRDEAGRFTEGNQGNPNPPRNRVVPGNQLTVTHGGYARYFSDQSAFDGVDELGLQDELRLCRARVISVTKALNDLAVLLDSTTAPDEKATIYGQMLKAETAMERNICRVESIERTLSSLRIDDVTVPKIEAETDRIIAATRKLEAESSKLEREQGGDTTEIGEMVADLQGMGTGGLMS